MRRSIEWVGGFLALLGVQASTGCGAAADAPLKAPARNLILISIDTLRADRLGCYGYQRPTSPTLDRLASEGAVFVDASATSPWTLPSHASMFTGLYPQRHGALHLNMPMVGEARHLATILGEQGFATYAVVSSTILRANGLERGFDELEYVEPGGPEPSRVTDRTIARLRKLDRAEPFFFLIHYIDPHADYGSLPEFRSRFVGDYDGPVTGASEQLYAFVRGTFEFDVRGEQHLSDLYDAGIRQLDGELERLFDFLEEGDWLAESLVVITSDHGEEFFEHGQVMHGLNHYAETLRVPLILRGARVPVGLRSEEPVSLVDVLPTCLSLLGLAPEPGLDGLALDALWQGSLDAFHSRSLYSEADFDPPRPGKDFLGRGWDRSIRRGRFKLHFNEKSEAIELYDLVADPGEQSDVSEQHPRVVENLLRDLGLFLSSGGAELGNLELTGQQLEDLMNLGYAGEEDD